MEGRGSGKYKDENRRKEEKKEGRKEDQGRRELIYTGGGYTTRVLSVLSRHSEIERGEGSLE